MGAQTPRLAITGELLRLSAPTEPTDGIRFEEILRAENLKATRRIDIDMLNADYRRGMGTLCVQLDSLAEFARLHHLEAAVAITLGRHDAPLYVADIHRISGAVRDLLESIPQITALPHRARL